MGSSSAIRAGRALVEITADDSKLQTGLRRAQAKIRRFAATVGAAGKLMAASGAAIVAPAAIAAKLYSSVGDELDKMSQRIGVSVESLSELGFAAEQSGSSLKSLEKGLKTMETNLLNAERGLSTSIDNLDSLGLSFEDLKGKNPEEQFKLIADKIAEIEDPSRKAAISIGLLGRAGLELVPLLSGGRKGMEDLQKQARDLGLVISTKSAKSAAFFTDQMNILAKVLRINVFEIGASLAPTIISAAKTIRDIGADTVKWIRQNREAIVSVVKMAVKVALAGTALIAFSVVANAASTSIGVLTGAIGALNVALKFLIANPEVAVFVALAAAAIALAVALKKPVEEMSNLAKKAKELREAGDRQRATDLASLNSLKKLSSAGELNARQMTEAKKLLKELKSRYGDLGIEIGKNTVKIMDQVLAFKKLNEGRRKSAIADNNSEIKALLDDIDKISKQRDAAVKAAGSEAPKALSTIVRVDFVKISFEPKLAKKRKEVIKKIAKGTKLVAGKSTDEKLLSGGISTVPKTGAGTGGETDRLKKLKAELAKINEDAARKKRTQIANEIIDIKKAGKVKIDLIKQIAAEEKAVGRTKEAGQFQGQITDIELNISKQIVAIKEREAKRLKEIDAETKASKQQDAQSVVEEEKRIGREIARARIELTLTGAKKERALLNIERQKAIEDAKAIGADAGLVDRLFDLKNKAIQATLDVQTTIKQSVLGSFSTSGIAQGFTSGKTERLAEVTAKATQATATSTANMARIIENMADNGLTFA